MSQPQRSLRTPSVRSNAPTLLLSPSTEEKGVEFDDYSISLSMAYLRAVQAAGGVPWVAGCLPNRQQVAELVRRVDGVVLTGGDDVDPKRYTKSLPAAVAAKVIPAHPDRDRFELGLIQEVLRQRKPLLCICRGHQILNVALGGTLFADISLQIPRALNHSRTDKKDRVVHDVECASGSLMAQVAGKGRLGVNSSHHQAVARIARALRATAMSRDGIVEGMELAETAKGMLPFLLSVQFHPERLFHRHVPHLELFRMFVRACRPQR